MFPALHSPANPLHCMFCSCSQFYPNISSDAAPAPSINVAWSSDGVTDGDYMAAFMHVIMPVVYSFAPDLILVSAGFDAADRDFLGELQEGMCFVSVLCGQVDKAD